MPSFVGSIDCGTTSSRFIVFNEVGEVVVIHQVEFDQIFPHVGWMEERPEDLVNTVVVCVDEAVKKLITLGHKASDIKAIGITNQRETSLVWSKST